MLSQCLVPSITKKVDSYLFVLGQQPLIALQIQTFHESIPMYLISSVMPTKKKKEQILI